MSIKLKEHTRVRLRNKKYGYVSVKEGDYFWVSQDELSWGGDVLYTEEGQWLPSKDPNYDIVEIIE